LSRRTGYLRVGLRRWDEWGKTARTVALHTLVALTFIPNPHGHKQVQHRDGNKMNCHKDNLSWESANQNMAHAFRTGLASSRFPDLRGCYLAQPRSARPWRAQVMHKRKVFRIGTFATALEAATAYNEFIRARSIPAEANCLQILASRPDMTTPGWFRDPAKVPPSPRRKTAAPSCAAGAAP
jgi:hypothetical protein